MQNYIMLNKLLNLQLHKEEFILLMQYLLNSGLILLDSILPGSLLTKELYKYLYKFFHLCMSNSLRYE